MKMTSITQLNEAQNDKIVVETKLFRRFNKKLLLTKIGTFISGVSGNISKTI